MITLQVNGARRTVDTWPFRRLIDVLRQDLQLTGVKEGCGEGECGACAVLLDGELVNSCLVPVMQVEGAEITTIEGLAQNRDWDQLRQAFIKEGGAQCGICTPGMLMAASSLLRDNANPRESEVRKALAGNICRCTGYKRIVSAVLQACRQVTAAGE